MNENAIIISGLLILSIISGMLGLGVAFAAIPSGVLSVMGGLLTGKPSNPESMLYVKLGIC